MSFREALRTGKPTFLCFTFLCWVPLPGRDHPFLFPAARMTQLLLALFSAVCAHCAKPARLTGHRRQHSSPPGLSTLRSVCTSQPSRGLPSQGAVP